MRISFKTIQRAQMAVLLFLLTAFSATAQFPVRTVYHYPTVQPPAEIRYMDGRFRRPRSFRRARCSIIPPCSRRLRSVLWTAEWTIMPSSGSQKT